MLNDGWEFQRSSNEMHADERILVRNPRHNMVGMTYVPNHAFGRGQYDRMLVPGCLYFGSELVLKLDFYRSIEAPRMELSMMDVGRPVPIGPCEYEMEVYEANVNVEDKPQELIILPEDIPMIMDKIIKAQEPRAKEILADQRKREGLGELQMKAKILTFGKTA